MVDAAGTWKESYCPYPGRSHGHADVVLSKAWSKTSREKSAEAIVVIGNELLKKKKKKSMEASQDNEGLNLKK